MDEIFNELEYPEKEIHILVFIIDMNNKGRVQDVAENSCQ